MATNSTIASTMEPQYVSTSEEMVIDTNDFDIFSSLDDLVVEDVTTQEKVTQEDDVAKTNLEDDATEEVEDNAEFDFADLDDDDMPEDQRKEKAEIEDEDEEDLDEDTEDEDENEVEDELEENSEEEEVDYETYEITLPDGGTVTLQDAIEGYRTYEVIKQEKEDFETAKGAFKEEAGNTLGYLKLAKLEADRVIEDYVDFDWGELSRKDPQAYVENREFLDKYTARKQEIVIAMDELETQEVEVKKEEFQTQARTCLTTLKAEVTGWSDTLYQDLMQYAIDNGSSEEDIAQCIDPTVFKMLNKARQFDLGKQIVKAKIKRKVGSPKKVVKSTSKNTASKITNRDRIADKLARGITSDSDVFDALED